MPKLAENGSMFATVRADFHALVDGVAFVPERADGADAAALLARDGAVILRGYPAEPHSLVRAAADVFGTRLRQVQPARTKDVEGNDALPLHNESRCQVIEVDGQVTDLYGPDADHILILCAQPADCGGGTSIIADAYRLVDRIRNDQPDLWEFLVGTDVDRLAAWRDHPDIPSTPSASRPIEFTRTGRRIVSASWGMQLLPRDLREEHQRMLDRYADVWTTLSAAAPRFSLDAGDILFVDNYRCWHGVDAHDTLRVTHTLTVRTVDAR